MLASWGYIWDPLRDIVMTEGKANRVVEKGDGGAEREDSIFLSFNCSFYSHLTGSFSTDHRHCAWSHKGEDQEGTILCQGGLVVRREMV